MDRRQRTGIDPDALRREIDLAIARVREQFAVVHALDRADKELEEREQSQESRT